MPQPLTVAFAADENYFTGIVGTLSGILRRNTAASVKAVILDCGISDTEWDFFEETLSGLYSELAITRIKVSPDQLAVFNPYGR